MWILCSKFRNRPWSAASKTPTHADTLRKLSVSPGGYGSRRTIRVLWPRGRPPTQDCPSVVSWYIIPCIVYICNVYPGSENSRLCVPGGIYLGEGKCDAFREMWCIFQFLLCFGWFFWGRVSGGSGKIPQEIVGINTGLKITTCLFYGKSSGLVLGGVESVFGCNSGDSSSKLATGVRHYLPIYASVNLSYLLDIQMKSLLINKAWMHQ